MKIFVSGATGLLGKRVTQELREKNHRVVSLARSENNLMTLQAMGVETLQGSLFDLQRVRDATKECDAILHLATHIPKKPNPTLEDWKENDRIRIEGTRVLLEAAEQNGIRLFLQQSITMLHGDLRGGTATAETPLPENQLPVLRSAWEMERMIAAKVRRDLSFIIVRFATFYSADSYHTRMLIEGIKNRRIPILGDGSYFWNFIHVDDAAQAVVFALQNHERMKNRTVDISDFHPILFREFVDTIVRETGSRPPKRIPRLLGRFILGADTYKAFTNSHRIVKDRLIVDWNPRYETFQKGLKTVLHALEET